MAGRRSTRRLAIKGFPFFLIYRPAAAELLVVAVAHQSRRPDYWLARASGDAEPLTGSPAVSSSSIEPSNQRTSELHRNP
jgi:hypothetical protein